MYYAEWVYEPHLKVKDLVKRLFGIDDMRLGSDKKKQLKIIEALRLFLLHKVFKILAH